MDRILSAAVENGYRAIDLRAYMGEGDIANSGQFKGRRLAETAARLRDCGIEVSAISGGLDLSPKTKAELASSRDVLMRYLEIADSLGCGQLRFFGGRMAKESPVEEAARMLEWYCGEMSGTGVIAAVETHDDWTDTLKLAELLASANCKAYSVWDVNHPLRQNGEDAAQSLEHLLPTMANTHWKDSFVDAGGVVRLCLPGQGTLPLLDIFRLLADRGYGGYLTFEWEKFWHQELEEPEIAIPRFARTMREYEKSVGGGAV